MWDVEVDTRQLESSWRDALEKMSSDLRTTVNNACSEGAAEARSVHQYKDQTGALTQSIAGKATDAGRGYANGIIEATAKYASYVEEGTAAHDIWPKEGQGFKGPTRRGQGRRTGEDIGTHRVALRWQGSDGLTHFARMVHHPGSRSFPFLGPAALKAERVLIRDSETSIESIRGLLEG